jgi:Domain of unknown function (DUF4326)
VLEFFSIESAVGLRTMWTGRNLCEAVMTTAPIRIQRKRSKGWKMPENTIYVGRPTKWGNQFNVTKTQSLDIVIERYRWWAETLRSQMNLDELRGKNLACWCPLNQPCHADVLLELANANTPPSQDAGRRME